MRYWTLVWGGTSRTIEYLEYEVEGEASIIYVA